MVAPPQISNHCKVKTTTLRGLHVIFVIIVHNLCSEIKQQGSFDKLWVYWLIWGGHALRTPPPPPQDQILSFSHTFSMKSARVEGPPSPLPTGNPGSATDWYDVRESLGLKGLNRGRQW